MLLMLVYFSVFVSHGSCYEFNGSCVDVHVLSALCYWGSAQVEESSDGLPDFAVHFKLFNAGFDHVQPFHWFGLLGNVDLVLYFCFYYYSSSFVP